jgi:hypothetical protein
MFNIYVVKTNGERELFSLKKVFESALRAGARRESALEIAEAVKRESYDSIKTSEISRLVNKRLKKDSLKSAVRFNLKRSIKELGPTGFPFEKYVCEIFKSLGFGVKINQIVPGSCILDYEIDFVAENNEMVYIGECKYRNFFNDIVDLKDSLANYARFLDILDGPYLKNEKRKGLEIKTILVTNGKFTSKALAYSDCKGIDVLGWRSPQGRGLEHLVEERGLYPVTILPSLKEYMKEVLVENQIMLVKDLVNINIAGFSAKTKLQEKDLHSLTEEARLLLGD